MTAFCPFQEDGALAAHSSIPTRSSFPYRITLQAACHVQTPAWSCSLLPLWMPSEHLFLPSSPVAAQGGTQPHSGHNTWRNRTDKIRERCFFRMLPILWSGFKLAQQNMYVLGTWHKRF